MGLAEIHKRNENHRSHRAGWLRAAVLGANDGLVSTNMIDMLIVAVPVLDLQYPPSSPAVIKACVNQAGFTAKTVDLNLLLKDVCGNYDKFLRVQYNFENVSQTETNTDSALEMFFDNDKEIINEWLIRSLDIIDGYKPRWLGISVFSYKSHKATLLLCDAVRRKFPNIKIVLGGRGASAYALGPDHSQFRIKMEHFNSPGSDTSEDLNEHPKGVRFQIFTGIKGTLVPFRLFPNHAISNIRTNHLAEVSE